MKGQTSAVLKEVKHAKVQLCTAWVEMCMWGHRAACRASKPSMLMLIAHNKAWVGLQHTWRIAKYSETLLWGGSFQSTTAAANVVSNLQTQADLDVRILLKG